MLARLPASIRRRAEKIPVVLEVRPSAAMIEDGLDPDLMGLFTGNAISESDPAPVPLQIYLYLRNIWDEAEHDQRAYRKEVRRTLLHEVGHYLGLDEDDLAERDLD